VISGQLSGAGYPAGRITRAGAGMGAFSYPRVFAGNPTGKISSRGCGCGLLLPVGYVPVAIFTPTYRGQYRAVWLLGLSPGQAPDSHGGLVWVPVEGLEPQSQSY
jgi:hypothetical protein